MNSLEIIGLGELGDYIRTLPRDTFKIAKRQVAKSVFIVQKEVLNNFTVSSGPSVDRLHSRSGALKRSIKSDVVGSSLNELAGSVFSDIIYSKVQEEGDIIKARNKYVNVPGGPYLNIPLSANKTAAGVTRFGAREVFRLGGFIVKSKKGNWLVMDRTGVPMFVLKKSVEIPARLGMEDSMKKEINPFLKRLDSDIDKRLNS